MKEPPTCSSEKNGVDRLGDRSVVNHPEENHEIANPLKGLKKPPAQPRLHSLSTEDEQSVFGVTDDVFREFLFATIHTGLRPFSELGRMTADDVDQNDRGMMWRGFATKTKKTRMIPLMPQVADLTRKLMETAPKGTGITLFRNSKGTACRRVAGVQRHLAIKRKLGWDDDPIRKHYSSYTCRHTFCHRMLSGYWNGGQGCSIEVLAELIGDTPKVAFDHYGREWGQHYQEPLWAAIGVPPTTHDSEETSHGG